jgi:hypothetical protein
MDITYIPMARGFVYLTAVVDPPTVLVLFLCAKHLFVAAKIRCRAVTAATVEVLHLWRDRVRSFLWTAVRYDVPPTIWRGRCVAQAYEGLRNESNNKAHEPTSGRSTNYGSGHLIRAVRDIGHIFSSLCPFQLRAAKGR